MKVPGAEGLGDERIQTESHGQQRRGQKIGDHILEEKQLKEKKKQLVLATKIFIFSGG